MHDLTKLIQSDMKPALGVTEPGCIAYAVSKACSYVQGDIQQITVEMNSGLYKNAFTCGIPGSSHYGAMYAAAFGAICADSSKGLLALNEIGPQEERLATKMIEENKVKLVLHKVSSRIYLCATVETENDTCSVIIENSHTNITQIVLNGKTIWDQSAKEEVESTIDIHNYSVQDMLDYVDTVPVSEISFIQQAYDMNMELFQAGLSSSKTTFIHHLYKANGNVVLSASAQKSASLLCNGAIEARVVGVDAPAMSITGSGAHGIIATLPLYAYCKINDLSSERLYRATALSYLICMYIKEYSGKLSAFCGCGIAAGTGMACALTYVKGGKEEEIRYTIQNMAGGITGMICDGGNQGCTMKGIVAVDSAFRSSEMAMDHVYVDVIHGINGKTAEQTMKFMGAIADPGMTGTEKTILDILKEKEML